MLVYHTGNSLLAGIKRCKLLVHSDCSKQFKFQQNLEHAQPSFLFTCFFIFKKTLRGQTLTVMDRTDLGVSSETTGSPGDLGLPKNKSSSHLHA